MHQERRIFGYNFETRGHSVVAHFATLPGGRLIEVLSRAEISGEVPEKGPALLVANHGDGKDPMVLHYAVFKLTHRTMRCLARLSLIYADKKDSAKTVARRTQHDILNTTSKFAKVPKRLLAWYLRRFDPIPLDLGESNFASVREALKQAKEELRAGHLVGIFPEGTRRPKFDLLDFQPGVSLIVRQNPDVPIVPVGLSGLNKPLLQFRPVINFGQPFKYEDIRRSGTSIADYTANKVGELIADKTLVPAWRLKQGGLTKQEIQEMHVQNPDLHTPAVLVDNFGKDALRALKEWF